MLNLLSSLVDTIGSIISFVINSITSLIHFFTMIPSYVTFIVTSINVLPNVFIPFIIASVWVTVYLFILGRN